LVVVEVPLAILPLVVTAVIQFLQQLHLQVAGAAERKIVLDALAVLEVVELILLEQAALVILPLLLHPKEIMVAQLLAVPVAAVVVVQVQ
jgi:hypothetical protein